MKKTIEKKGSIIAVKVENNKNQESQEIGMAKRDGLFERWYGNGQIAERKNYKNGKLDGLYEWWDTIGKLRERCYYKEGELLNACQK